MKDGAETQYPGAIYHVMNRGDRREGNFTDDHDRNLFLETLGETCAKRDWQVHSWCLTSNHFHLVVETPRVNLLDGMKWFLSTDTSRFNHRHEEFGHLFQGRYKAVAVEQEGSNYFAVASTYIHLNPARAGQQELERGLPAPLSPNSPSGHGGALLRT